MHPTPLVPARNLLMDEPLITQAVSLLSAMTVPPSFLIYPSITSANWWQTHCPTDHSEAAGPTRSARPSQASGGRGHEGETGTIPPNHQTLPATPTIANCRHWRQRHFWRFWLLPPNLGLSQQKSQWPQSIRRRQAAQVPHLRFCRRFV